MTVNKEKGGQFILSSQIYNHYLIVQKSRLEGQYQTTIFNINRTKYCQKGFNNLNINRQIHKKKEII